jgi:hypothetical protein
MYCRKQQLLSLTNIKRFQEKETLQQSTHDTTTAHCERTITTTSIFCTTTAHSERTITRTNSVDDVDSVKEILETEDAFQFDTTLIYGGLFQEDEYYRRHPEDFKAFHKISVYTDELYFSVSEKIYKYVEKYNKKKGNRFFRTVFNEVSRLDANLDCVPYGYFVIYSADNLYEQQEKMIVFHSIMKPQRVTTLPDFHFGFFYKGKQYDDPNDGVETGSSWKIQVYTLLDFFVLRSRVERYVKQHNAVKNRVDDRHYKMERFMSSRSKDPVGQVLFTRFKKRVSKEEVQEEEFPFEKPEYSLTYDSADLSQGFVHEGKTYDVYKGFARNNDMKLPIRTFYELESIFRSAKVYANEQNFFNETGNQLFTRTVYYEIFDVPPRNDGIVGQVHVKRQITHPDYHPAEPAEFDVSDIDQGFFFRGTHYDGPNDPDVSKIHFFWIEELDHLHPFCMSYIDMHNKFPDRQYDRRTWTVHYEESSRVLGKPIGHQLFERIRIKRRNMEIEDEANKDDQNQSSNPSTPRAILDQTLARMASGNKIWTVVHKEKDTTKSVEGNTKNKFSHDELLEHSIASTLAYHYILNEPDSNEYPLSRLINFYPNKDGDWITAYVNDKSVCTNFCNKYNSIENRRYVKSIQTECKSEASYLYLISEPKIAIGIDLNSDKKVSSNASIPRTRGAAGTEPKTATESELNSNKEVASFESIPAGSCRDAAISLDDNDEIFMSENDEKVMSENDESEEYGGYFKTDEDCELACLSSSSDEELFPFYHPSKFYEAKKEVTKFCAQYNSQPERKYNRVPKFSISRRAVKGKPLGEITIARHRNRDKNSGKRKRKATAPKVIQKKILNTSSKIIR